MSFWQSRWGKSLSKVAAMLRLIRSFIIMAIGIPASTIVSVISNVLGVAARGSAPSLALPTQDNTLAGSTVFTAGNPAWQPDFSALETRFTALGAA